MAEIHTLPHIDPAPQVPDLPGHAARLQRKAECHKAAIARLETTLARTKAALRIAKKERGMLMDMAVLVVDALRKEQVSVAGFYAEETEHLLRAGTSALRQGELALAKKRDHALIALRGKVAELHAALRRAKTMILVLHRDETGAWARTSPEMQQINQALGES